MDVTEQSTHLDRDRRMNDDWLEMLMEDWAEWRLTPEIVLSSPTKTSLKVAEEMRPDPIKIAPPITGSLYTDNAGNALPLKIRRTIHTLVSMWKRGQQRGSRCITSRTPNYMPHHRMSKINKAVNKLHEENTLLWAAIIMRYEYSWTWKKVYDETGLPKRTYYDRLKRAKKQLKRYLKLDFTCTKG